MAPVAIVAIVKEIVTEQLAEMAEVIVAHLRGSMASDRPDIEPPRVTMMGEDPTPLTPADQDLAGFDFMPLFVRRLRKSKSWLMAKWQPQFGFYMVNLWTAAWLEVAAASLEDDDDVLAAAMCHPER